MYSRLVLLALMVCAATLHAGDPERIYSFAKDSIEVDLQRVSDESDQRRYQIRFFNRNDYSVKVHYRVVPKHGDDLRLSVVLPANVVDGISTRDPVMVKLPAGDYREVEFRTVTRGYMRERTGTRVSSDGTTETYSEIEFTTQDEYSRMNRDQLLALQMAERRYREQRQVQPQPVTPAKEKTWEEQRDEQLRNERKVWPNPK